jgi:hypothetical protein
MLPPQCPGLPFRATSREFRMIPLRNGGKEILDNPPRGCNHAKS